MVGYSRVEGQSTVEFAHLMEACFGVAFLLVKRLYCCATPQDRRDWWGKVSTSIYHVTILPYSSTDSIENKEAE